jgi:hypothetical protein
MIAPSTLSPHCEKLACANWECESRTPTLKGSNKTVRLLEEHHSQDIRNIFGVEPAALTAPEAVYLAGFKSSDALRNRAAAAGQENERRASARAAKETQRFARYAERWASN